MKSGDLILIPFPFADIDIKKIRPAVIPGSTQDEFSDLTVCAVSSNLPDKPGAYELCTRKSKTNRLKVDSIIKVDRVVTIRRSQVLDELGCVTNDQMNKLKLKFKELIDQ